MSAYPPGVTGNEPEIAGLHESVMEVSCRRDEAVTLYRYQVLDLVDSVLQRVRGYRTVSANLGAVTVVERLREDLLALDEASSPCDWEGAADVVWADRTTFTWTCPQCGSDWEDEVD